MTFKFTDEDLADFCAAEEEDEANGRFDDPEYRAWAYGATAASEPVGPNGHTPLPANTADARVVSLEEFAALDEQGAAPIVGDSESILIPENGDVMLYGDRGAGKTTLPADLAFHLASGTDWLGLAVPRPVRCCLIENEGPRPLFRRKLKRKLEAWRGASIDGRITVFEQPWAQFTFADEEWRDRLAQLIIRNEIEVLVAGPLARLGMDAAGTLQEVRAFMDLVEDLRRQSARRLTVVLVHHENKGGTVSGAWEGAGDTLLHVQAAGNGHTIVFVQKARWASEHHHKTLRLAWTDGEGFRLEGDRDPLAEMLELLADGRWRTAKEIAAPQENGGIGCNPAEVRKLLNENVERFTSRTGEEAREVGRHPSATVWQVVQTPKPPESPTGSEGDGGEQLVGGFPLRETTYFATPSPAPLEVSQPSKPPSSASVSPFGCVDGGEPPGEGAPSLVEGWDPDELQRLVDQERAA
jgi:hypothetical protein